MLELFIRIFQGFSLFSFQCSVSLSFFVISDSSFILPRCLLFVNNFFIFYLYVLFVKCLLLKHLSVLKYIRIACLHFSISTVRKSPIQCVSRISLTIITPLSFLVNNLFILFCVTFLLLFSVITFLFCVTFYRSFFSPRFFAFIWHNFLLLHIIWHNFLLLFDIIFFLSLSFLFDAIILCINPEPNYVHSRTTLMRGKR